MKNLPKLSLSKLSILVLAAMCLGVIVYDWTGSEAPDSLAAEAAATAEAATEPAAANLPLPEPPQDPLSSWTEAAPLAADDSFYAEYRLQREQVRAEELELLQSVIEDVNTSKELRDKASARKLEIAQIMEYELMTENVLYAKQFGQSVVMLGAEVATVILSGPFDDIKAAQVAEAVSGVTGVSYENVVIVNR